MQKRGLSLHPQCHVPDPNKPPGTICPVGKFARDLQEMLRYTLQWKTVGKGGASLKEYMLSTSILLGISTKGEHGEHQWEPISFYANQ